MRVKHSESQLSPLLVNNPSYKIIGLLFYHGIGDCMMFVHSIQKLKQLFPDRRFVVLTLDGQDDLFKYYDIESEPYTSDEEFNGDVIFDTIFYVSPDLITKNDYCCVKELGIDPVDEDYKFKKRNNTSRIIGVHFHNTCLPDGANPDRDTAKLVWDTIKDNNLIPLEIHLIHPYANPVNSKFDFIDFTTRDMKCSIDNLYQLIGSCNRFIGVNSGPYFNALSILGINNVVMLEKDYTLRTVVKDPNASAISVYDEDIKSKLNDFLKV